MQFVDKILARKKKVKKKKKQKNTTGSVRERYYTGEDDDGWTDAPARRRSRTSCAASQAAAATSTTRRTQAGTAVSRRVVSTVGARDRGHRFPPEMAARNAEAKTASLASWAGGSSAPMATTGWWGVDVMEARWARWASPERGAEARTRGALWVAMPWVGRTAAGNRRKA